MEVKNNKVGKKKKKNHDKFLFTPYFNVKNSG